MSEGVNFKRWCRVLSNGLVAVLLSIPLVINAQDIDWKNYTASQLTTDLVETESTIWVGTMGGLFQIDKASGNITEYTHANSGLAGNAITALALNSSGTLWIGTNASGLIKYDGSTWSTFDSGSSMLESNEINDVVVDAGDSVWVAHSNGIYMYNGSEWKLYESPDYSEPDNYYTIEITSDDTAYVGLDNDGIAKFALNSPSNWTLVEDNTTIDFVNVGVLSTNTEGHVWAGNDFGELFHYDGSTWSEQTSNIPSTDIVTSLEAAGGDSVYVGTVESGLVTYDGSTWNTHNESNSDIPGNSVHAILKSGGALYMGTNSGTAKLASGTWTSYETYNSGLQQTSMTGDVAIDGNGTVWIGTGEESQTDGYGLVKYDGSTWEIFNTSNSGLPNNTVLSVAVGPNGNIYAGTDDGLGIYDGSTWEVFEGFGSPLPEDVVVDITVESDGTAWIVTQDFDGGIATFDGSQWTTYTSNNTSVPLDDVTSIDIDGNGNAWIGTRRDGVIMFDGTTWTQYSPQSTNLTGALIHSVTVDHNNIVWAGLGWDDDYGAGIARFDGSSWTIIGEQNSVYPGGIVNDITTDASGSVWISTRTNGLIRFSGGQIEHYRKNNSGLASNDVRAVAFGDNGDKWIVNGAAGVDLMQGGSAPVAEFSTTGRSGDEGTTITFHNESAGNPTSLEWTFQGGSPATSTVSNPTVTYSAAGTYDVTLIAENTYGTDTLKQTGFIEIFSESSGPSTAWQVYKNSEVVYDLAKEGDSLWVATNGGLVLVNEKTDEVNLMNQGNTGVHLGNVLSVAIDSQGNKWLGTSNNGLVRYSNGNWAIFNSESGDLHYDQVTAVSVDSEDNIWFVSGSYSLLSSANGGLARYDGSEFTNYTMSENDGASFPPDRVNALSVDQGGNIWVGFEASGLFKFDGADFTEYTSDNSDLPANQIDAINVDGSGTLWIGAGGLSAGLIQYDGSEFTVYDEDNSDIPDDWVQAIDFDSEGNVWAGTQARGLVHFDGAGFSVYNEDNSGILSDNVSAVLVDESGQTWVGTKIQPTFGELDGKPGLVRKSGSQWTDLDLSKTGLPSNSTADILHASDGKVWIGVNSSSGFFGSPFRGGLVEYDYSKWNLYNKSESGIEIEAIDVLEEDASGNIWMAQSTRDDGVYRYDGTVWTNFNTSNSALESANINDIEASADGSVWIATDIGLASARDTIKSVMTTGNSDLPGDEVTSVALDKNGKVWIGTYGNGLASYDTTSATWTNYDDPLLDDRVGEILVTSENDIIVYFGGGFSAGTLARFDGSTWTDFTPDLTGETITSLDEDLQGNIWVGFDLNFDGIAGVGMYDGSEWTEYNSLNSNYPGSAVEGLSVASNGDIWLATNANGVVVFRGPDAITAIEPENGNSNLPDRYTLSQNYPNPFNPATTIQFGLPEASNVRLEVYNLLGQRVTTLINKQLDAGYHTIRWNASEYSSGVYFYRIRTGEFTQVHKMVLVK
ncbi:MAG: T9SS type A sorting domain-containing protein [Candidatus Marinimicrobia bacterium]|nr:T9SS type A sorting domain-containing protein [Candidatus Neomarinimicrobiota bacterium]MCF7827654.1 T9SS type A sorting domain-containing protein [Candidatus Neomarinimicrobiota bacterium]MCF7881291.1 T9SS type A sorting domain-containing protein [Candidatus Neomarinimicrobiota bacterium]